MAGNPEPGPPRRPGVPGDLVGGRYRLIEVIGSGVLGRVWRGRDELLRRDVAVKEIGTPPEGTPSAALDRQLALMRQAEAAARVDHPGIAQVLDAVWQPDRSWIVTEYVRGRSLHEALLDGGTLGHREAARIGLGVLAALGAAHAAGVAHGDVKPGNVLLGPDGRVAVTDFGLAAVAGTPASSRPEAAFPAAPERRAGGTVAEPALPRPERGAGTVAEPADLWQLGAILFTAVAGRPPRDTEGTTSPGAGSGPDHPALPDAARLGPLAAVIAGLLARDPGRRLTAAEAEPLLRTIADGEHDTVLPDWPATPAPAPTTTARTAPRPTTTARPAPRPTTRARTAPGPTATARPAARRTTTARPAPRARLAIVIAAMLAAAVVAAVLGSSRTDVPGRVQAAHSSSSSGPTTAPMTALPPVTGLSPVTPPASAGGRAPTGCALGTAVAGSVVAASTVRREYALPPGWLWYSDRTGLAVAVPEGWLLTVLGAQTCFRDPAGDRLLSVDTAAPLVGAPLGHWQRAERAELAAGSLPGYRAVAMTAVASRQGGAAWEYTWQPAATPRLHERRVWLSMGRGRAYVVTWATRDQDWTFNQPFEQLILASLS